MAIIGGLLAAAGRFFGKLANLALGWAGVLLFGRVPQAKQSLLTAVTLGSIAWVVALLGVIVPDVGTFLLAAIPKPAFIQDAWVRIAMLIVAIVLPLVIGFLTIQLLDPERRPKGSGLLVQVLRGYPYAAVLAITLVFLAAIAVVRKVRAAAKRWQDAHVALVVKPGGYEEVVRDLEQALDAAGLDVHRERASPVLTIPPRLLAAVGGSAVRDLVPDELVTLKGEQLEILVYPSDVALLGTKEKVARARAAIAARLTESEAYLTSADETQAIEDELTELARRRGGSDDDFRRIDERLAQLVVPQEDWDTLYRLRLQVENQVRLGSRSQPGTPTGRSEGTADTVGPRRRPGLDWAVAAALILLLLLDLVLGVSERLGRDRHGR